MGTNSSEWGAWNTSDYDYEYEPEEPTNETEALKTSLITASMAVYAIIFVLGVPGNAAVIWVAGFLMARRPVTVWFLHLSAADLLLCLTLPFLLAQLALDYHWPFGLFLCKVLPSVTILTMFASVFVLTGISIDRCLATWFPFWSRRGRSICRAHQACGLAWGLALLMSLPSLLYRQTIQFFNSSIACINYYGETPRPSHFAIGLTRFTFAFLIPFLVIAVSNSLIVLSLRASRFSRPRNRRPYRLLLLVLLGFFLCWAPYHVGGLLLLSTDKRLQAWVRAIDPALTSLAYLNSCLNPFLYAFAGRQGRGQLRRGLQSLLEGAFEEEVSLSNNQPKATVPSVCQRTEALSLQSTT